MPLLVAITKEELPFLSAALFRLIAKADFELDTRFESRAPEQDLGQHEQAVHGFLPQDGQGGQGHRGTRPGRSQGRAGCLSAQLLRVLVTSSAQPAVRTSGSTSETWPEASVCSSKLQGKSESSEPFTMGSCRQALLVATTTHLPCRVPGLPQQPQRAFQACLARAK